MDKFNELPDNINIDPISSLEALGHIEETETDGLYRKADNKRLSKHEIQALILPYVLLDVKVSDRKLMEITGIDRRSIAKVRNSEEFLQALLAETNKEMILLRQQSLQELFRLIADPSVSPSVKQKLLATSLQHSADILAIYAGAKKELPPISIDDILKELEQM
ncbi:MAG: hypothetical protein PHF63_02140 [Herbinix sp.]|jgi:hypothetical protein|nr:hypothetical protein [Herbinix sp.]